MMTATKFLILNLYKNLLQEARKFPDYNFRNYALRKIKHTFKENRSLSDPDLINSCIAEAKRNLDIIRRQVIISCMYNTDKLVIEHIQSKNR